MKRNLNRTPIGIEFWATILYCGPLRLSVTCGCVYITNNIHTEQH